MGHAPSPARLVVAQATESDGIMRNGTLGISLLLLLLCVASCASSGAGQTRPGSVLSDADLTPPLERVIRIFEGKSGREIDVATLVTALAESDAVFLGETHLDEVTHRTEHAILEGLLLATQGRVVLAMEMFTRGDQAALDRYLAGETLEAEFLAEARAWSNYRSGYRALIETAKRAGVPIIGANLSPAVRRKIAMGGAEALESLTEAERVGVAKDLLPNDPLYWERYDRTVRGHGGSFMEGRDENRLTSIQSLWDNTMGESCALALAAHPDHVILHVNGGFHTRGGLGTADQFAKRSPDARMATVAIVPVGDLAAIDPDPDDDRGTYIVYAEARARGYSEGTHAVTMRRELRYRLHVPKGEGSWPLLVWIPDEGSNSSDDATRWRLLVGKEAAVAVIEQPYPVIEEDLHQSGRYTWEDTFSEDVGSFGSAAAQVIEQVTRYSPVDPERVLVAGEGAGGRMAAAMRWQDRDGPRALVIDPGPLGRLSEAGLPDPLDPRGGQLTILASSAHREEWDAEASDRASVGFPSEVESIEDRSQGVAAVFTALGLESKKTGEKPRTLWLSHGSPLARQWAGLAAARLGGESRVEVLEGDEYPDSEEGSIWLETDLFSTHDPMIDRPIRAITPHFAAKLLSGGKGIPMPPGAFGGTVVLVLPKETEDEQRAAWLKLEEDDVTRKRSRFVGLRVAETGRERDLPAVLAELKEEGKSVMRIVPVRFCASAEEMRAHKKSVEGQDEGLRIAWSPGLGGELWRLMGDDAETHP